MPAGCEFACENKDCKNYNTGIVVTGPWPIAPIDLVINAPNVRKNKPFQEGLIKLKKDGNKYACITYPNFNKIEKVGYRIQLWCDACLRVYNYDAMIKNKDETIDETINNADIPANCTTCNMKLKSFVELLDGKTGGIVCPACNVGTTMHSWFTNEITTEYLK